MKFLHQGFQHLSFETRPKLYTTLLRGWPMTAKRSIFYVASTRTTVNLHCKDNIRQTVPGTWHSSQESSATDSQQFKSWYHKMVTANAEECSPTRHISEMDIQ